MKMVLSLLAVCGGLNSPGEKCSTSTMAVSFINCNIPAFLELDVIISTSKGNCKVGFGVTTDLVNIKSCAALPA